MRTHLGGGAESALRVNTNISPSRDVSSTHVLAKGHNRCESSEVSLVTSSNPVADSAPVSQITAPLTGKVIREYRCKYRSWIQGVSQGDIDHLKIYAPALFGGKIHTNAKDKYGLNWLNIEDVMQCLEIPARNVTKPSLGMRTRNLLKDFITSRWDKTTWLDYALKHDTGTLPEAILLLIMAEYDSIDEKSGVDLILN